MTRIGITGHMNLTPASIELVHKGIRQELAAYAVDQLVGISALAVGADTIFAQTVVDIGARLEVILPSFAYRERKVPTDQLPTFDRLIARASDIHTLPFREPNRDAYKAANDALLARSEVLLAVWDGGAPTDKGGTGAVVASARERGIPVHIIWPAGAQRS